MYSRGQKFEYTLYNFVKLLLGYIWLIKFLSKYKKIS
jgi:hypothetical protein